MPTSLIRGHKIRGETQTPNQRMKKQFLSIAFACTVALGLVGCASTSSMTIKDNKPKDEAAIRELMRRLCKRAARQRHYRSLFLH
jgi:hypothetical protein